MGARKQFGQAPPAQGANRMNDSIDPRKISMNKTYSVTFAHVGLVKEMADELTARESRPVSEGEVIRRAVDLLYAATFGDPTPQPV